MLKGSPGLQSYKGFGVSTLGSIPSGTFYRGEKPSDYSARMLKEKGDPLAQFSGINPESITGKQKTSKEKALKFVSGGAPLGSSVVSGAANKIVSFDRAKIKPKSNNLQGLISNITSNVYNNLSNIQNIFGSTEKKETKQKQGLFGFFGNIKDTISLIQFLGSKKNIDKLKDNLNNLKDTFSETFEVAKALRKAIVKIFKELSGIDGSGGGGGGGLIGNILSAIGGLFGSLIPGRIGKPAAEALEGGARTARVAEEGGNIFSKIGRFAKGGGKAALIGGGALAAGTAMSGLSGPGDTEFQPGETPTEVPGDLLDKFNSILDRFDKVLDGLKGGKTPDKGGGAAKSSGGGSGGSPGGGGGGGGGATPPGGSSADLGLTGNAPVADVSKDTEFISEVQKLSKEVGVAPSQLLSMYQAESGINPASKPGGGATGIFQLMFNPKNPNDTRYGLTRQQFAALSRADQVKIHRRFLNDAGIKPGGFQGFGNVLMANIATGSVGKPPDTPLYKQGSDAYKNNKQIDTIYGNGDGVITAREYANFIAKTGGSKKWEKYNNGYVPPQVATAAPQQIAQTQGLAVAQKQGQQPQLNVVQVPSQQVQAAPQGNGIVAAPPPAQNGPTAPFLPSGNYDNFLTLYSRMVYNIVDG